MIKTVVEEEVNELQNFITHMRDLEHFDKNDPLPILLAHGYLRLPRRDRLEQLLAGPIVI